MNFITPSKSPKIRVFNYYPTPISQHLLPAGRQFVFTSSVASGAGGRKKEMLRKKYHVVRKKYHVVRKIFYVASIFGGAASRKNRPPWELSSTPWEVSSTAGDFSPTASLYGAFKAVYRTPVFGGAPTSLADSNIL